MNRPSFWRQQRHLSSFGTRTRDIISFPLTHQLWTWRETVKSSLWTLLPQMKTFQTMGPIVLCMCECNHIYISHTQTHKEHNAHTKSQTHTQRPTKSQTHTLDTESSLQKLKQQQCSRYHFKLFRRRVRLYSNGSLVIRETNSQWDVSIIHSLFEFKPKRFLTHSRTKPFVCAATRSWHANTTSVCCHTLHLYIYL